MSELPASPRFDRARLQAFAGLRLKHLRAVLVWTAIIAPMAATVGSLCALFLWSLDLATRARFAHPWLLYGLPLAGLAMGLAYRWRADRSRPATT
ncbi:hypothetical protein [Caulobacter soli]|uniref:hypothetical protein n=1 Tax=Caulobacter soli TaxID=2708539 RepID=UPI00196B188E|nr:hypothetical protein [Caulobacter soli]